MQHSELLERYKTGEKDLAGLDLNRVDLSRAVLAGVYLSEANLVLSILPEADLRGANLEGARVGREQLAQASSLEGAILPNGTHQ